MIYCIASGNIEYFDINYTFTDEQKRDAVLEKIKYQDYFAVELELNDNIEPDKIKNQYVVSIWENSIYFQERNTLTNSDFLVNNKFKITSSGILMCLEIIINKDVFDKGNIFYKHKLKQIYNTTQRRIKNMLNDGLGIRQIMDILESEVISFE